MERARPYLVDAPQVIEQLVLAADQFVVRRSLPGDAEGRSIIAGYPWFGDWGRDTMISLPGLTLATGRPEVGARILHTFAHYVESRMFPAEYCQPGGDEAKARAITPILRVAGCKRAIDRPEYLWYYHRNYS